MNKPKPAKEQLAEFVAKLKEEGNANRGYCATGLTDYAHRHASASDCRACIERDTKRSLAEKLEMLLVGMEIAS